MTKKTVKDLDNELILLQGEFKQLEHKYDTLTKKYEALDLKFKESMSKTIFKCSACDEEFNNKKDLKNHMINQHSGTYQCDVCNKQFKEEWKFSAHVRSHKKYPCEHCEKSFPYESLKVKHVTAVHENLRIYCHFYNNQKECPFDEQCIFLHKQSEECKFGVSCERNNCMYQHKDIESSDEHDNDEDEIEDVEDVENRNYGKENNDEKKSDDEIKNDDEDNENDVDNEAADRTFLNPFLDRSEAKTFNCDYELCEFKTYTEPGLEHHKIYCRRNPKNKHPCDKCDQAFESKKKLKGHIYCAHTNPGMY